MTYLDLWKTAKKKGLVRWLASGKIERLRLVLPKGRLLKQKLVQRAELELLYGSSVRYRYDMRVILAERTIPKTSHIILFPEDPNHEFQCVEIGKEELIRVGDLVWEKSEI